MRRKPIKTLPMNIRVDEYLVRKLQACAKKNLNTLSQEVRERLANSFHVRKVVRWEIMK